MVSTLMTGRAVENKSKTVRILPKLDSAMRIYPFTQKNDVTLYSSDRIVQLTGNGLLTFSPRIPSFDKLYTENEVVYFDDQFDLAQKIQFYAVHPEQAKQIAEAGWHKTQASFNAKRITQFMLEVTFDQPLSAAYEWAHEVYA